MTEHAVETHNMFSF